MILPTAGKLAQTNLNQLDSSVLTKTDTISTKTENILKLIWFWQKFILF